MAWTYSGNPSTSVNDEVRFLIGDTDETDPQLQDEEITYLLAQADGVALEAAIDSCRVLIARFARQVSYTIGPESVQAGDRVKAYQALRAELESAKYVQGGPSYHQPHFDLFDIGIHDNKHQGRRGLRG